MVTFRVDEDILRAFDEWAWVHKLTRTAALTEYMQRSVGAEAVLSDDVVPASDRKARVISELKAGLAAERERCSHPKDQRQKFAWGSKCGECGSVVR